MRAVLSLALVLAFATTAQAQEVGETEGAAAAQSAQVDQNRDVLQPAAATDGTGAAVRTDAADEELRPAVPRAGQKTGIDASQLQQEHRLFGDMPAAQQQGPQTVQWWWLVAAIVIGGLIVVAIT